MPCLWGEWKDHGKVNVCLYSKSRLGLLPRMCARIMDACKGEMLRLLYNKTTKSTLLCPSFFSLPFLFYSSPSSSSSSSSLLTFFPHLQITPCHKFSWKLPTWRYYRILRKKGFLSPSAARFLRLFILLHFSYFLPARLSVRDEEKWIYFA